MVDRSVRVVLSSDAQRFIASMNTSADSVKKLGAAAVGVRPHFDAITTAAERAGRALLGLNLPTGAIRDIHAFSSALRDLAFPPGGLAGGHAMHNQIRDLQADLARLRAAAGAPIPLGPVPHRPDVGGSGDSHGGGSGGLFGNIVGGNLAGNLAGNAVQSMFSGIGAAVKSTFTQTADYETQLKTFGAVTQTVGETTAQSNAKMKEAGDLAIKLGGDVTIAGASAADAAQVLVELAKGGLSVSSSFAAAKGTLQLASAATVSVGVAAGIQTSALNMFSLSADKAGKVADILSNTAAASAGEITDYAEGMKYTGVQAHALGMTLTDTSAALGVLGQSGEKGSIAGTNLNDVLLRLNPQTKKTRDAMHELGVVGFDANGRFEGMVPLINQLSAAHKRLSPAAFESATKMAFGVQGMRAAGIYAEKGSKAYTAMYGAIDHGAGVVAFSTAKMSGLGGSLLNVKNQLETAQVTLGEKFSPALQRAMDGVSRAIPIVSNFLAGPAIGDGFSKLGTFFKPLIDGAEALGKTAMPYVKNFLSSVGDGFHSIITFIHPVVTAIGDFWMHASDNGSVAKVGNVLDEVGTAFKNVMAFIAPVGAAIGGAIKWIGGLGEFGTVVGTVVTAMLGFRLVKPLLTGLFNVVPGFTAATAAVKGFGATYRALASTGMGSVSAALGAATQGAANLGKGLLSAFGGPVGLAIMGITTVIALWPTIMDKLSGSETSAATSTQNHTDAVKGLSDALEASNGKVDETVRKNALTLLQSASWGKSSKDVTAYADRLSNLGVSYSTLVDGMLNVPGAAVQINNAYDTQVKSLQGVITAGTTYTRSRNGLITSYSDEAKTAQGNLDILRQLHDGYAGQVGSLTESTKKYQENAAAIKGVGAAATVGSGGVKDLKTNTGDMTVALDAARASAAKSATPLTDVQVRMKEIGAAAKLAGDNTSAFYDVVKGTKGAPDIIITPITRAFADYKQAVTDATTTTDSFITDMDKLAGRNVPLEDTMRNAAAAARGIGSAARKKAADEQAVRDAKAALDTAKAGHVGTQAEASAATDKSTIAADALSKAQARLTKMQASGKATAADLAAEQAKVDLAQTAATKSADAASTAQQNVGQQVKGAGANAAETAAKQRALADAQTTVADSADGIVASYTQYQKTATDAVRAVSEQAFQQHGFAAAVKVGTVEMAKRRAEFIAQQPAAAIASGAADKLANSYGLIPKTVKTLLTGDPMLAKAAAADAKAAYDKATKDRITTLKVSTSDAIADVNKYGLDLFRMPTSIVTKFIADNAAAKKEGLNLYNVYNRTTGNWVAQFLTPNAAAAKLKAGDLVRQYDKGQGTWTANLTAVDNASVIAKNVKKQADLATQLRTLIMNGQDNASPKVQALLTQIGALQVAAAKPITLTVDAAGNAGATTIHADGSFVTKGGGHGIATGGQIHGPGTGTSDSIPVRLSDGEFVVKASATAKHLPLLEHINSDVTQGFAEGGLVGPLNVTANATGNINPALAQINSIISNARTYAAGMNAAAAAMMSIGPSGLLGSQNPAAWGWGVGKNIVPFSFHGIDFPAGVASGTEPIWSSFLAQLEPMILGGFRPGEDWGFENRDNVNSPGSKSFHSYGLALDVNAPENGNGSTPGNGPGQVPPAAGALARRFNMLWGGDFTGTKDPMHFELHQRPGGSGGASLAGGVAAGAAPAASSGVDQWVPLMDRVIAGKGLPVAYIEPIMYAQMSHESSGNPAAINNYDINAQNGDPSKGLLQFTGATFQRYADPGFNSNIWDPESQMRAFLNYVPARYGDFSYLTKIGNGAYADGGFVSGPGGPRSDSINARLSNGEFVVNSAATAQHLDLLHAINGYANGGVVGSALALSGRTAATVGPELANVVQALTDIAQAVTDARTAATDKRALENTAWDNLNNVAQAGRDHRGNAAFNLGAAQEIMRADLANVHGQNKAIYQARAAATASAQDKLNAALAMQATETRTTTARIRVTDQARVAAASRALAAAQARQQSTPAGAAAGKLAADEARIESISRVNAKMAATDRLALAKADREWKLAQRTRISYDAAASAAERFQTSQQHAYRVQQSYAAQVDQLSGSLATASQNLSSLQSSRSSMMSGISGTVAGFDSGILGHPDTRNTIANMIKGQQYDIAQAQKFNVNIVKDRKLGLSKELLQQIAAAGVDGGGVFANAIAKGTPAQIKQLNATQASLHRIGDNVGATVAGDFYDIGIRAGQGMVKGLESQIRAIEKAMIRYANAATGALSKKLRIHSPSRATHELGVHAATGFTNGVLSGYGAAHSAMAGMVQLPQPFIPAQSYGRAGGGHQSIDVQVFLDGQRIDDRVDVKINGFAVDLGHSLEKASMQDR